jgi:2-polyprenyl-3-methyl-5-hydroxy-6-metoxy-1,4-benzoquinol methylase
MLGRSGPRLFFFAGTPNLRYAFPNLFKSRVAVNTQNHWEGVYQTKSPKETSWYAPHLQISLDWITQATSDLSASIIDIGAGESTLVDDLMARGYGQITLLDISNTALERTQIRLRASAASVHWITGSVLDVSLPPRAYDLWHDRAVFHFLTDPGQRQSYSRHLSSSLKPGGHVIIATFGPEGPEKCSGLPVMRYDAIGLQQELGPSFQLVKDALFIHETPYRTRQQFIYCDFMHL